MACSFSQANKKSWLKDDRNVVIRPTDGYALEILKAAKFGMSCLRVTHEEWQLSHASLTHTSLFVSI
ncbi:MAG: hypothetical protein Q8O64_00395 [Sideroxyarcus sp.]|nr:hypothetical protein [Sideroxyarcus sp.]